MAALLDKVHEEKHDIRYWRIIIGPWLFHYVDILYDRYQSIQSAKLKYPFFDTVALAEDSFVIPRNTLEFMTMSSREDLYNLQIYSKILCADNNNFRHKSFDIAEEKNPIVLKNRLLSDIKKNFIKTCLSIIARVETSKSVYLFDPYFPKSSIVKIFFQSKGRVKAIYSEEKELPSATPNRRKRNYFTNISLNNNGFENLIKNLLPYDIPHSFLETYSLIRKESLNYPSKPKAIMSWISWYFNEEFKFWAAAAAESGSSLYGVQHGGNYGIDQYMKSQDHEVAVTDEYYSWGWVYPELQNKIVPMPASKVIVKKNIESKKNNNEILFAGNLMTRYLFRMEYPTTNQSGKYIENQIKFFKSAGFSCQNIIRYRALTIDGWLDIVRQIQDEFPNMTMDDLGVPFQESLMNCRLFISDHPGTVYAEALSLNRPTILFWDPELYIHRIEAHRCFENLHAVGILHYSPEAAADKVCEVYDNIDRWWNEPERQSARSEFCDNYARTSQNAMDEWMNVFRRISG